LVHTPKNLFPPSGSLTISLPAIPFQAEDSAWKLTEFVVSSLRIAGVNLTHRLVSQQANTHTERDAAGHIDRNDHPAHLLLCRGLPAKRGCSFGPQIT
jgi:hypothetical protein